MQATTTGLPPYPGHGSVTRRQRDSAELERIKIRAQERKRRIDSRVERLSDIHRLPPLPVYDRGVLEAHRAAKIGRARQEELANRLALLGRTTRTRSTDVLLSRDNSDSEHRGTERRALSTMFGGSSSDDGGALREAFNAIEEADEEPSPNASDDSDYQDTPSADRDAREDEQQDEDDAEEGEDNEDDENQGGEDDEEESEEDEEEAENEDGDDGEENDEDGGGKEVNELTDQREGDESEQDDEEETDDKFGVAPNLHQIAHQRLNKTQRVRRPFPHFVDGFGTT
ncbi:hypothetical protein PF003_g28610 [Phytophthora fragariae]|nr:hypothetical protein PF003_g28610 [Phytophthora fragariae]